jgi:hypothetical protein
MNIEQALKIAEANAATDGTEPLPTALAVLCDEIHRLRAGSNYVANKEVKPTVVYFKNGRKVWVVDDPKGAYLDVDWQVVIRPAEVTKSPCKYCGAERHSDRLCVAIWPGLPQWSPTLEQPQQDFFEAAAESLHTENARYRRELLNIAATAVKWAVAAGGDTPLALIGRMARDALGITSEQVDAECKRINDAVVGEKGSGE